jgi:Bacterial alpha-L-rhamnosidase C-terminal domain/Bacterial alpha-L-rhamnosidase 6 hairpin glycosidase domain
VTWPSGGTLTVRGHLATLDPAAQTSNAVPLAFGLVPEDRREAAAKLATNVRGPSRGHLNTGMFGFETFTVRPGLFGDLTEVWASTETVRGRITVHWRTGPGGACSST